MAKKFIFKNLLIITFYFLMNKNVFATPKRVFIVRHAEKLEEIETLSNEGYQRAQKLVDYFTHSTFSDYFGVPDYLFASSPKKSGGSVRSIETLTPLASSLGMEINTDYNRDDYEDMVKIILNSKRYDGKNVLISWAHKRIVDIAYEFGGKHIPHKWEDEVFDRVWVLEYEGDSFSRFYDIPQELMPGDSSI